MELKFIENFNLYSDNFFAIIFVIPKQLVTSPVPWATLVRWRQWPHYQPLCDKNQPMTIAILQRMAIYFAFLLIDKLFLA